MVRPKAFAAGLQLHYIDICYVWETEMLAEQSIACLLPYFVGGMWMRVNKETGDDLFSFG